MTAFRADEAVGSGAAWRADLSLVLSRTVAALILIPTIAMVASRVHAGRLGAAAIGVALYGLLAVAALHARLATGWRVAAMLIVLGGLAFNIILSRGLGLNVGALAGVFVLLTLLAWGRVAGIGRRRMDRRARRHSQRDSGRLGRPRAR